MISPCVNLLRHLTNAMNGVLGSKQGTRHAFPDTSHDIAALMDSLAHHEVYKFKEGRALDEDDFIIKDVIVRIVVHHWMIMSRYGMVQSIDRSMPGPHRRKARRFVLKGSI